MTCSCQAHTAARAVQHLQCRSSLPVAPCPVEIEYSSRSSAAVFQQSSSTAPDQVQLRCKRMISLASLLQISRCAGAVHSACSYIMPSVALPRSAPLCHSLRRALLCLASLCQTTNCLATVGIVLGYDRRHSAGFRADGGVCSVLLHSASLCQTPR